MLIKSIAPHPFRVVFSMGIPYRCKSGFYPIVAKVGGLQSQGAKGEAVVIYCEPIATPDLEFSGFPVG